MESALTQTTQILRRNIHAVAFLQMLAICAALCAQGRADYTRFGQFESNVKYTAANEIDTLVMATLRKKGIEPANLYSDAVFIRRAYLDVIGSLPEPQKVRAFLKDRSPNKRAALIDALLQRDEFADYWSLKWCDPRSGTLSPASAGAVIGGGRVSFETPDERCWVLWLDR